MDFTNPNEQAAVTKATLGQPPRARAQQRMRLGDMLVAQKVITSEQLAAALANQKRSGRRLGKILIEDGFSTEEVIARALALQLNVPFVELALNIVDTRVAKVLDEAQARRFRAMPIDDRGSALRLGMVDPSDYQSFDEIQRILRRDIDLVVVTESRLNAVLDRIYSKSDQIVGLAREVEEDIGEDDKLGLTVATTQDEAPVAKLLQTLLDDAARARASDIHIEPQERKLQIRFRVDGALVVHTEAESR
ncbi:MAG TPA: MSHA biogenesis protein MshE, partial [Burkholderiaceae bacterium]|nr:MSHA biogenesis protein MshE [Burkholderiaceae bacterium]